MGSGVALLDYDQDGKLDVFLVQSGNLHEPGTLGRDRLFRNVSRLSPEGDFRCRFEDTTEQAQLASDGYGMGVAVGDIDNDGWLDLYVTNVGPNQLWRNRGDGTFEDWSPRIAASNWLCSSLTSRAPGSA